MLDKREAFKAGFLLKCAQQGMTLEETEQAVDEALYHVKRSMNISDVARAPVSFATSAAGNLLGELGGLGMTSALLAPPLLGAGAGYGLSKMTDIDDTDVDTVKKNQLIEEYKRQIAHLKRKRGVS